MNAEDREHLEILKIPPLSVADDWLIARLEAEVQDNERLRKETVAERVVKWIEDTKAAERRAEALEAELGAVDRAIEEATGMTDLKAEGTTRFGIITAIDEARDAEAQRAEALEAECREERAALSLAEDEVQRLRELRGIVLAGRLLRKFADLLLVHGDIDRDAEMLSTLLLRNMADVADELLPRIDAALTQVDKESAK